MAQAMAKLNYLKMAPRKVRKIASTIRGLTVAEAEAQLMLRSQRAGKPILKLLRSCLANARFAKLAENRLVVKKITVDQGPMLKRFLPRAMGRATPIHKKMSHIILVLEESGKVFASPFKFIKQEKTKKTETKKKTVRGNAKKAPLEMKQKETKKEDAGFFKKIFRRKSV